VCVAIAAFVEVNSFILFFSIFKAMSKLDITIGVCAMEKKVTGKPMKEILRRLADMGFTINVFEERAILEDPIEEWPLCDCMIAFFSGGFPLAKAEKYSELRKPYVVNDLHLQWTLMDRVKMYELLTKHKVPTPRYVIVDHLNPECKFEYHDDHVVCDGVKLKKPIVEKPQDGDDHNVRIYWPHSSGGGCTKLFRKIGDRSSEYDDTVCNVRNNGVFIYEEFVNTSGVDVKVYTCGPDYAHAEARKSPAMDGRVTRNERGKEERYPVILSEAEKSIARTVVLAFKQNICGLDLLRSKSGSVVCDVNGWSFVKDSTKYWDDTAQTLGMVCRSAVARMRSVADGSGHFWQDFSIDDAQILDRTSVTSPATPGSRGSIRQTPREKLLCVSIVARHADRTPKQKMKMTTKHPALLGFCDVKKKEDEVKLKQTADLQRLLQVSTELLEEQDPQDVDVQKLLQLRQVLEMSPLEGMSFYRKVQLKPKKMNGESVSEMQLILKWGGKLTCAGKNQAVDLGHELRVRLYPARESGAFGLGGLLRLHATYRHDLKIYTSDEGRVILSAAAFVKGLLDMEGALPPIASMMVSDEAATQMLDIMPEDGRGMMDSVKAELSSALHGEGTLPEVLEDSSLQEMLNQLGNSPNERMHELLNAITELVDELSDRLSSRAPERSPSGIPLGIVPHLNHSKSDPVEYVDFVYTRWRRLKEEFFDSKSGRFDISKLPDIYDCSLYDILHNQPLQLLKLPELHERASALAKFMVGRCIRQSSS
jgi:inositol hexakisphosphate/diphosphoinositol-pentakisphosphate kinase